MGGQLVTADACGGLALEGERGVLDVDSGAHQAGEADLAAVAEQVLAAHEGVAEGGRAAGGGNVHEVGFDVDGGEVQDGDVVSLGGGEGGEAQGGGEQGGDEDERLPASRYGRNSRPRPLPLPSTTTSCLPEALRKWVG